MCYNPTVSLFTAIIEFALSGYMLFKYRLASTRYFFAAVLIVLGAYQFSEFMLCKTSSPEAWATAGFAIYTFLPALGLHGTMTCLGRKSKPFIFYALPAFFVILAILYQDFILLSQCQVIFVTVRNALFQTGTLSQTLLFSLYTLYYAGFIMWSCILCLIAFRREPNFNRKKILLMFPIGVIVMTLPTYILMVIFPTLNHRFPSVLCHFALLLALVGFVGVRYEEKYIRENKI